MQYPQRTYQTSLYSMNLCTWHTHTTTHEQISDKVDKTDAQYSNQKHSRIKFNETELQWCENVIYNFVYERKSSFCSAAPISSVEWCSMYASALIFIWTRVIRLQQLQLEIPCAPQKFQNKQSEIFGSSNSNRLKCNLSEEKFCNKWKMEDLFAKRW